MASNTVIEPWLLVTIYTIKLLVEAPKLDCRRTQYIIQLLVVIVVKVMGDGDWMDGDVSEVECVGVMLLLSGLPFNWAIQVSKDLSKQGTQVVEVNGGRRENI